MHNIVYYATLTLSLLSCNIILYIQYVKDTLVPSVVEKGGTVPPRRKRMPLMCDAWFPTCAFNSASAEWVREVKVATECANAPSFESLLPYACSIFCAVSFISRASSPNSSRKLI